MTTAARQLPTLTGSEPYVAAVVVAGADLPSSQFMLAPVNKREGLIPYGLTVGAHTLTRAMCNSDIAVSTASGNTSLFVPLLANITDIAGYTYTFGGLELGFRLERRGPGILTLTFDSGVVVEDPLGMISPVDQTIQQWIPINVSLVGTDHWRIG